MGFSVYKIPGHSGTSFKHRKAFILIKNYNNKNISYNRGQRQNVNIHPKLAPKKHHHLKAISSQYNPISFFLFITFIALIIYGIAECYAALPKQKSTFSNHFKEYQLREQQNAYRVLVYSGKIYLRGNQLQQAHDEFVRALKIDPYGMEARIEVTKLLLITCEYQNNHCNLAKDNIRFLEEMNHVTPEFSVVKDCVRGSSVFLDN